MRKSTTPKPVHHAVIAHRAHDFRHHLGTEEAALWQALRASRLGVRFARQLVIGPFIADFVAPSVRLIVEVDGGYHSRRQAADARRDDRLACWGWRVLRVDAREVMRCLPRVVRQIESALRG